MARGGALRGTGYVLLACGTLWGMTALLFFDGAGVPVLTAGSVRTALSIGALLVTTRLLERHEDVLSKS